MEGAGRRILPGRGKAKAPKRSHSLDSSSTRVSSRSLIMRRSISENSTFLNSSRRNEVDTSSSIFTRAMQNHHMQSLALNLPICIIELPTIIIRAQKKRGDGVESFGAKQDCFHYGSLTPRRDAVEESNTVSTSRTISPRLIRIPKIEEQDEFKVEVKLERGQVMEAECPTRASRLVGINIEENPALGSMPRKATSIPPHKPLLNLSIEGDMKVLSEMDYFKLQGIHEKMVINEDHLHDFHGIVVIHRTTEEKINLEKVQISRRTQVSFKPYYAIELERIHGSVDEKDLEGGTSSPHEQGSFPEEELKKEKEDSTLESLKKKTICKGKEKVEDKLEANIPREVKGVPTNDMPKDKNSQGRAGVRRIHVDVSVNVLSVDFEAQDLDMNVNLSIRPAEGIHVDVGIDMDKAMEVDRRTLEPGRTGEAEDDDLISYEPDSEPIDAMDMPSPPAVINPPSPSSVPYIVKLLKAFSCCVRPSIEGGKLDVMIFFSALRSDGVQVTVTNKNMASSHPHLLIDFYELYMVFVVTLL